MEEAMQEGEASSEPFRKNLLDKLLEKGLVSEDQKRIALRELTTPQHRGKTLGALLVDMGFITEQTLGEILAESSGYGALDIHTAILDQALLRSVPQDVVTVAKAIPINQNQQMVTIAMSDIFDLVALERLRKYFPKNLKLQPIYAPESYILEVINAHYAYDMSVEGTLHDIETIDEQHQTAERLNDQEESYKNPVVRFVNAVLMDAVKTNASDIHLEPEDVFVRIRYRLDGVLQLIRSFHKRYWPRVVVRLKILGGMDISETRYPQDGHIHLHLFGRMVDIRVSTLPTIHGENVVLRILDRKQSLSSLDAIDFDPAIRQLIDRCLLRPEGMVLVTGPTGSGKTTTLYAMLNSINTMDRAIFTLEDPVEYQMPLIRQTSVQEDHGLGFSQGIRSMMRQDPDVILVGEIRDEPTATMAVRAAMTGHQIFSTLHSNDAIGAIPRLVDIGIPPTLLSGTIIGILAQRLVRKLCEGCKTTDQWNTIEVELLTPLYGNALPSSCFRAKEGGCPACRHTGYAGRVVVAEMLIIDDTIDRLISESATRSRMLDALRSKNFCFLLDDALKKMAQGLTDLEAISHVVDITKRL